MNEYQILVYDYAGKLLTSDVQEGDMYEISFNEIARVFVTNIYDGARTLVYTRQTPVSQSLCVCKINESSSNGEACIRDMSLQVFIPE